MGSEVIVTAEGFGVGQDLELVDDGTGRWEPLSVPVSVSQHPAQLSARLRNGQTSALRLRLFFEGPAEMRDAFACREKLLSTIDADPEWGMPSKPTRTPAAIYRKGTTELKVTLSGLDKPRAKLELVLRRVEASYPTLAERRAESRGGRRSEIEALMNDIFDTSDDP